MDKKRIVIVTGTGGPLGTGHMQRMLGLASYMEEKGDFDISILPMAGDYRFPAEFAAMVTKTLPAKADLIIRDMRDSSGSEILSLSKIAPVLAVDDAGKGKALAAHSINILPLPSPGEAIPADMEKFLYGYNFTRGIESIPEERGAERDIDIAIYTGFSPPPGILPLIERSLPGDARSVIFSSGRPVLLTGKPLAGEPSYAGILTRAKIIMTHFGITMFEANICGCMVAALNPTPYHGKLTSLVMKDMSIIHSAEYGTFDPVLMNDDLLQNLKKKGGLCIPTGDIINRINSGRENFTKYIYKILM